MRAHWRLNSKTGQGDSALPENYPCLQPCHISSNRVLSLFGKAAEGNTSFPTIAEFEKELSRKENARKRREQSQERMLNLSNNNINNDLSSFTAERQTEVNQKDLAAKIAANEA